MEKKTPPKFPRRSTRGRPREQTPEDKALAKANEETRARNWKRPVQSFKPQAAIRLDFDIEESSEEDNQKIPPKKRIKSAPIDAQSKGTKRRHPGNKSEHEGPKKKSLKAMLPKKGTETGNTSKTDENTETDGTSKPDETPMEEELTVGSECVLVEDDDARLANQEQSEAARKANDAFFQKLSDHIVSNMTGDERKQTMEDKDWLRIGAMCSDNKCKGLKGIKMADFTKSQVVAEEEESWEHFQDFYKRLQTTPNEAKLPLIPDKT